MFEYKYKIDTLENECLLNDLAAHYLSAAKNTILLLIYNICFTHSSASKVMNDFDREKENESKCNFNHCLLLFQ